MFRSSASRRPSSSASGSSRRWAALRSWRAPALRKWTTCSAARCAVRLISCWEAGAMAPRQLCRGHSDTLQRLILSRPIGIGFVPRRLDEEGAHDVTLAWPEYGPLTGVRCANVRQFAEGDSRILMQKLARDRMAAFRKAPGQGTQQELRLCGALAAALKVGRGQERVPRPDCWVNRLLRHMSTQLLAHITCVPCHALPHSVYPCSKP